MISGNTTIKSNTKYLWEVPKKRGKKKKGRNEGGWIIMRCIKRGKDSLYKDWSVVLYTNHYISFNFNPYKFKFIEIKFKIKRRKINK